MGFLGLFNRSSGKSHRITDEDREKAAEINRLRFSNQRAKLEQEANLLRMETEKRELQLRRDMAKLQADIKEYESYDDDDDSDDGGMNVEKMMQGLMFSALANKQAPPVGAVTVSANHSGTTAPTIHLSDDELYKIWDSMPKQYKLVARNMSDDTIRNVILSKVGNVDEETIARALNIVKGG